MARVNNAKAVYDKPTTIIGEDVVLNADLMETKSSVQIAGKYNGNIKAESSVVVANKGKVTGNIMATFLLVSGTIEGNIEVAEQLHITSSGKVLGDILCKSIVIDDGAAIEGNCKMKRESKTPVNQSVKRKK